jgi:hypothetical protein
MDTNFCTETATVVSASTAEARFPVANLKNPFRSKRWRSTSETDQWVKFDLQTAEDIDSVVILWPKEDGIRLSDSAVVKVQANATDVWTAPAVDVTMTIDNTYVLATHFFTSDQSYRYWRITVTDPANAYGYIELGVVWLGKGLDIPSAQNGFKYSISDLSKQTQTDFGHDYVDEYPTSASLSLSFVNMDYQDIQTIENAFRNNGVRKPVFIALDNSGAVFDKDHFAIYGKFSRTFGLSHVVYDVLSTESIVIEELA